MAMAFGIGEGIRQGINDDAGHPVHKFRVGDHVRVKYRGQSAAYSGGLGFLDMCDAEDASNE
ncbi:hypothetical protein [[Clostridium] aminophilum]|uniref:hypothetical protein n=1 Tax=[Clostridium] aminophilum TaxID=1526 RepID=UPI00331D2A25